MRKVTKIYQLASRTLTRRLLSSVVGSKYKFFLQLYVSQIHIDAFRLKWGGGFGYWHERRLHERHLNESETKDHFA